MTSHFGLKNTTMVSSVDFIYNSGKTTSCRNFLYKNIKDLHLVWHFDTEETETLFKSVSDCLGKSDLVRRSSIRRVYYFFFCIKAIEDGSQLGEISDNMMWRILYLP